MISKYILSLTEEFLGTKAANDKVFAEYIASLHPSGTPQKDELDNAENREEAGTTIFHRQNDVIGIYDYQIKGFFKDAASAINRMDKSFRNGRDKLPAFKTKIDQLIFVFPRFIPIVIPEGLKVSLCERPLRADTPKGPRVSVCRSEAVPAGSTLEFEVHVLAKELLPYIDLWFDYGKLRGLGQWRNSGKGKFTYKLLSQTKPEGAEDTKSEDKPEADPVEA